ncbi:hypothetical protein Xen7305DRAFT_00053700 [Xenococcus sp. PCC 7305]|uniref:hypothetical protein n=1 Tax=Xenococcus sp. PCC 7305 TaxID=102125 RepID=UPI0002ACB42E|nr:hypothetical protein [Xenococcus sp. PCC 7305]ELS05622.1 hypothetical protein Xen7305DRAFT_00053700 [Xenococcus sp. PCC 7305]
MNFMSREELLEEISLIKQDLELIKSSRKVLLKFRVSDYALRSLKRLEAVEAVILEPSNSKCPCCNGTGRVHSSP